jgi:hypothetical protein
MTRLNGFIMVLTALMLVNSAQAANSYRSWSEKHSAAKKKLLNVLTDSPKFNEEFCAAAEEEPEAMREYFEFLAGKGDRNTNDFVDKKGKEARLIRQCHSKFPERVRSVREWIRDYNDAALELVAMRDGVKWMCKGGEVPSEKGRDSDVRRDDKDAHDNRDGDKKKKKNKDD